MEMEVRLHESRKFRANRANRARQLDINYYRKRIVSESDG